MNKTLISKILAAAAILFLSVQAGHAAQPHAMTTQDVGAFFDGLMPYALERGDIPGAVIAVVKDGHVLFEKGYGYADIKTRRPVIPDRTLFRPGSISKTFMWTAVMQLVQAGKLDLDRDVNAYLDFRIPETYPKPITMRNLMTHTAGFGETEMNVGYMDPARAITNARFVKDWIPARIYPPGTVVAYSNYGAALAGYIVQRVSGEPFAEYISRHIFAPLRMNHSTFIQPLPKSFRADMASGYEKASGPAQYYEIIAPVPAGAMATTADDMTRFMIAHLQNGRFGDTRILNDATARLMHATAYQSIPPLNGMALGFYHEDRNGQRIVGHAGDTIFFHSDMHLFLDANVGIFISMNGAGPNNDALWIRKAVLGGFADRYFPYLPPDEPTQPTARVHGSLLVGTYESSRRGGRNFGSIFDLFGQTTLSMSPDGTLALAALPTSAGEPKKWREVRPLLWREVGGSHLLAAKLEEGRVAAVYSDYAAPVSVFQPVPGWRSAAWNIPLLAVTVAILLFGALQWPANALLRRIYGKGPRFAKSALRRYRIVRLACVADLVFICGIPLFVLAVILTGILPLTDQVDPWFRLFQVVGVIGLLGLPVAVYDAATAWRDKAGRWTRISGAAIALASISVAWFAFAFQLLSVSVHF